MSLYPPASTDGVVRLRPATLADAPLLAEWDRQPHVIACSSDRPDLEVAFDGIDWPDELAERSTVSWYDIAEVSQDGCWRPVGVMQVCDPALEPTHYWGDIETGLRAMDIWIGPPDALNKGYGAQMMTQAIDAAFAAPGVTAVVIDPLNSNVDAHRFYRRLGFVPEGRRMFGEDDCLVHRLTRAAWTGCAAA
ncbi:MAG TPA: GNAT family N-acetyltransferase [Caulobacteraceae bacterium]